MNPLAEIRRLRRAEIVNLTMTELMVLLVFVALTFSFLAREEGLVGTDFIRKQLAEISHQLQEAKEKLAAATAEVSRLQQENLVLSTKLESDERLIRRLLGDKALESLPSLEAKQMVMAPKGYVERIEAELESQKAVVQQQQRDIGSLTNRLNREGKGTGYPRCPISGHFLLGVTLEENGDLSIAKAWDAGAESAAMAVPGVKEMVQRGTLSASDFRRMATDVAQWGLSQEVPCRFYVQTMVKVKDLQLYRSRMQILDSYFYPTR